MPFKFSSTRLVQETGGLANPLISVIINNYNYEAFLDDAIDSVRKQTFRDFELIVVDDGSTDNSLARALRHDDVTVIQTQRLQQARACLEAIRHSRGQYIYILDADDMAEEDLLETVASELVHQPVKVQFQLRPIRAGHGPGRPFPVYPEHYSSAAMRAGIETMGFYVTPPTSGNVLSRDVFEVVDDIAYEGAIDGVSLLVCPFLGEVRSLSRPLARYRLHGDNESQAFTVERYSKERQRFVDRLTHLDRLLAERGIPISLRWAPEDMFYVADRLLLESLHGDHRPDRRMISRFLSALYRQRPLPNALKATAWMLAVSYGPKRVSARLARMHDEAWSPLRAVLRTPWQLRLRTRQSAIVEAGPALLGPVDGSDLASAGQNRSGPSRQARAP